MNKLCKKCGQNKSVREFSKNAPSTDGLFSWCKSCATSYSIAWYKRYGRARRLFSVEGIFSSYRSKAKQKGFEFLLTLEQFKSFWKMSCSYCGSEIKTIGLDRVNNSIGYVIENVVSCCKTCNIAKNVLSKEDFIDKCTRIASKHATVTL